MLTCAMRVLVAEDDEVPAETGTDSYRLAQTRARTDAAAPIVG
jgi:hypothetical protein